MPLERFSLENFRCFKERQEVELGSITVVLGRNNSGKSAVVRALQVLSTGIRTESPYPLDLELVEGLSPTFTDLIHGSAPHGRIHVGMGFRDPEGRAFGIDAEVQNIDDQGIQVVSLLNLHGSTETRRFAWEYSANDVVGDGRRYEFEGTSSVLKFQGLLPTASSWKDSIGGIDSISEKMRLEFDDIRYLGPFRKVPERFYRMPARRAASVGGRGEKALGMLAADALRGRGELTREVNELLGRILPGWRIGIENIGAGMYVPRFYSTQDPEVSVHIDDVGTGVGQVLPILIQRAADRIHPPEGPVIEIVEEPELHLHPSAHAEVADLCVDAARETRVRFLVETHSETFLLRLRRRVAEGHLAPKDLAVYFVEEGEGRATLRRISVTRSGNVDYWPKGVFSEDFEEARALAVAQAGLGDDAR
ncbi:DUF3696 domain-containing protein [Nocardiopsis sediminis]|uniref:DUF3696 domain-containing protein n=1 Tax=Nocardiopsis sediminis TaxID=1778267 RepID=A0ABV8FT86_9ACTN